MTWQAKRQIAQDVELVERHIRVPHWKTDVTRMWTMTAEDTRILYIHFNSTTCLMKQILCT